MLSKNKPNQSQLLTKILLSVEGQSPVFYLINIEYFVLYHGLNNAKTKEAIKQGLSNNLIHSNPDLQRKAAQWKTEHDKVLDKLASKISLEMKRHHKQLPNTALQRLPLNINGVQKLLVKTPNDYLCHFHLAWLYTLTKDYALAERHFNVAALQSQAINPAFSCFAFRHLAHVRFNNNKYSQALLAIEAACELNQSYNPELQFERIQLLSRTQRTTQTMPHLVVLINKSPHYEMLAMHDTGIQKNPSIQRYFKQSTKKHIANIRQQLLNYWKNDPLHLLNLDKELDQENSIQILLNKQHEMLRKLSPLLIFNEEVSSQLIQKRSRSIIMRSLNMRKQQYIRHIEGHQQRAGKVHQSGQWMLYAAVISLIALGLSYATSTIALQFNYHWPINLFVQSIVLGGALVLAIFGATLLHFTPRKLSDLLRQKQKLEDLSSRFGVSPG